MRPRLELHELLCGILGSRNVYFQPPGTTRMKYPAIRYAREDIMKTPADNLPYGLTAAYEIIVIDEDPDSKVVEAVAQLPQWRFIRHYAADRLNHDVFLLYY